MEALRVENLSISFGGVRAVNRVSFSVAVGERLAIIGPNGAGKTTLFNLINGQLSATTGQIIFSGQDVTELPTHRRAHLGQARAFQMISLLQKLSVLENVLLTLHGTGPHRYKVFKPLQGFKEEFDIAADHLKRVGLWEKSREPISSLSYGEQRKLEIYLALSTRPKLILLDEPSAGLTREESADVIQIIKGLESEMTVLVVDHDMTMVFGLADRIIVLHYGEIIADGAAEEIQSDQRVREIYMGVEECLLDADTE